MKGLLVVGLLSLAWLVTTVCQGVIQELSIRSSIARIHQARERKSQMEEEISNTKLKMGAIQAEINELKKSEAELNQQQVELAKSRDEAERGLLACRPEKKKGQQKKTQISGTLQELKGAQEAEKVKAQEDIQKLKQQLLDRDQAICAFVDKNKPEGMKLCS
ncbi:uncharacterized protein LOC134448387 [Engraulis encrasicolus]|uniref:uncharacterized protein LOC134448387 n=1 Tax=Engraulis encrasicolus TaxID=184585 RepID=UPI002FD2B0BE